MSQSLTPIKKLYKNRTKSRLLMSFDSLGGFFWGFQHTLNNHELGNNFFQKLPLLFFDFDTGCSGTCSNFFWCLF